MQRRTGAGWSEPSQERGSTTALVAELGRGSARAHRQIRSLIAEADRELLADLVDDLAWAAAAGSTQARELLLVAIADRDLAGPALSRLVSDPTLAADIAQEVLVAVDRSIDGFRGESRFSTWLYALARNVAVSQLRRHQAAGPLLGHDVLTTGERRLSSVVSERHDVHRAIASLPEPFREAIVLRDIRGLSYAEIADHQGIELNTVRSRLARGRAMLTGRVG